MVICVYPHTRKAKKLIGKFKCSFLKSKKTTKAQLNQETIHIHPITQHLHIHMTIFTSLESFYRFILNSFVRAQKSKKCSHHLVQQIYVFVTTFIFVTFTSMSFLTSSGENNQSEKINNLKGYVGFLLFFTFASVL